jgi:hypothetical protein
MKVGNDIFDILNGLGFRIKMFNEEGKISTDAEESTRFYSESPNIMISIEPEDNIIKLARGSAHTVEEMEPIRKRIKELAGDSLMKFEYKIFNKNITPKDQAYQIKRETMEGINELRKLAGLEVKTDEEKNPDGHHHTSNEPFIDPDGPQDDYEYENDLAMEFVKLPLASMSKELIEDAMSSIFNTLYQMGMGDEPQTDAGVAMEDLGTSVEDSGHYVNDDWRYPSEGEISDEDVQTMIDHQQKVKDVISLSGLEDAVSEGKSKVSNCCDAPIEGEIEDNVGRCSKCKEMAKCISSVDEGSKPDFLDLDGDGDKEEPMKKAVKDKKKKDEGRIEDTFDTKRIDKHDKPEKNKKRRVEEGFGKLSGSRKTSYQPLDQDVKIVVRHKKEVDEDVKGSRSRNISKIFIERAGERFKFPVNSMIGARAMARHMSNGGEVHDTIGEQIVEMTGNLSTVRQFLNAVKSKNLMNEENEEYVKLAVENLSNSRDILKSLAGAKTYTRAISELAVFSQNEIIEEDNEDLMNYFKETFVDSRIESVLGTLNKFNKQKQNFESRVNEELDTTAISKSFFRTLNPESNLTEWLTEMTSMVQGDSLKYLLLNSVRKIKNNVSLSEFETNTIKKIMSGQGSQINESINESKEFTDFIEDLTKDI